MTLSAHYQGIGGADVEFYSFDPTTGARILINDAANPNSIKPWRTAGYRLLNARVTGNSITFDIPTLPGKTITVEYKDDRAGRRKSVTRNGITTSTGYSDAGLPLSESYSGGTLDGLSVTNGYDQFLRRTNLTLLNGSTLLARTTNSFDTASRFKDVGDNGPNVATYSYVANSPLVGQIVFKNGGTTRMTTTKQWDNLNRLSAITNSPSAGSALSFNYSYNDANQRVRVGLADGSFWIYEYDALGQVISGKRYWADWSPVAGQQFEYGFDTIGNRTTACSGGDVFGHNLRYQSYSANNLNQYTSRAVPGYENVIGAAASNSTVTLWADNGSGSTTWRRGTYYRGELSVNNSTGAVWLAITNLAVMQNGTNKDIVTNIVGNTLLVKSPETFTPDEDGNLLSDGRWAYTWDGENRLIRMVANQPAGPQQRLDFEYDWMGRRIHKQVWNNTAGTGSPALDQRFVYDGWNLIAVLNSSFSVLSSFTWGLDLGGSVQGAGGIGGLLEMQSAEFGVQSFAAFDGNGNVAGLVKAADGTSSATYEHGPFGEAIRATGPMAKASPHRFSAKYGDDETGLIYYGYRYHSTALGRWLSRDPAEEGGGTSLYEFVGGDPVSRYDVLGLWGTDEHHKLINRWLQLNPAAGGQDWKHFKWHCIEIDVPSLLMEGSDLVDGFHPGWGGPLDGWRGFCDAQSSAASYQHSMRAWYESAGSARAKRDIFVARLKVVAETSASVARRDVAAGDFSAAEYLIGRAIENLGEAQHAFADDTSPAHEGFQPWYGPVDGYMVLGWEYADFVATHHFRESAGVYASKGDGPANAVAAKLHARLVHVLRE